jgi:alkylation response protein AidB-like acyl-CoA dehydrogenase
VATLGVQLGFERELQRVIGLAREHGALRQPAVRQRLADAWIGLRIMRLNALRTLSTMEGGTPGPEASITKLHWATWHRDLGELAIDVLGPRFELDEELQRMFLFARADTIYGGSNQIQRNVIGERVLGLPPEPKAGA